METVPLRRRFKTTVLGFVCVSLATSEPPSEATLQHLGGYNLAMETKPNQLPWTGSVEDDHDRLEVVHPPIQNHGTPTLNLPDHPTPIV
jgi:hypothetical protein